MSFNTMPPRTAIKTTPQLSGANQTLGASMVSALQNNPAQQQAADQPFNPTDEQRKGFLAVEAQSQSTPHTVGMPPVATGNNPAQQPQTSGAEQQVQQMNAPINQQTPWVSSARPNAWSQTQAPPPEISSRFAGGYYNQWQPGNVWNQSMQNAQYQMPYNPNLKR